MKPILYAIIAIFCYATQNVIIERKLAYVSPLANMLFYYTGLLIIVAPIVIFSRNLGLEIVMPEPRHYLFIATCGIILFFADYAFFSAYHGGGSLATITTVVALFPVMATFIKFIGGGDLPTLNQVVGFAFAIVAVYFASK